MKTIIDSRSKPLFYGLRELYQYRDLLWTLILRDMKAKYAQTYLGFIWTIFQPIMSVIIFTALFSKILKVETDGVPYPLFVLSGMSAWNYFSGLVNRSGSAITDNSSIISKIYFPKILLIFAKAIFSFIEYGIVLVLLFICMIFYHVPFHSTIIFLPVFILLTVCAALAVGIWISALTIRYRDFQQLLPYFIQLLFFGSPVAYSTNLIPEKWMLLFRCNPLVGIIDGMRWCLFGTNPPTLFSCTSYILTLIILISGFLYFKKTENSFVDII